MHHHIIFFLCTPSKADIKNSLSDSDPFLPNSFLGSIATAVGSRATDAYKFLKNVSDNLFIQTATNEFLDQKASQVGVNRNPASTASGYVVFTGTVSSNIPLDTALQSSDGNAYSTI